MNTAKATTIIPAVERHFVAKTTRSNTLKLVAAYARVSTINEEQLSSYEAHVECVVRLSNFCCPNGTRADDGVTLGQHC